MTNHVVATHEEYLFIQRLQLKDERAFRELMDVYGDYLKRFIYVMTNDYYLAEDICQETFITVFEKIEQYHGSGTFKGWITTIALNHCRARMRKAAWKRLFYKDMRNEELDSLEPGPEEISMNQYVIDQIYRLPFKYRIMIALFYYEDLSIEQISERLGQKQGTVKSKLFRARLLLKKLLTEGEDC